MEEGIQRKGRERRVKEGKKSGVWHREMRRKRESRHTKESIRQHLGEKETEKKCRGNEGEKGRNGCVLENSQ